MNHIGIAAILCIVCLGSFSVRATKCGTCFWQHCKYPGFCAHGVVTDRCHCCIHCAKGPTQACGQGLVWYGDCGCGLKCKKIRKQDFGICVRKGKKKTKRW